MCISKTTLDFAWQKISSKFDSMSDDDSLFSDDLFYDSYSAGPMSPEELTDLIKGDSDPLLEGLFSSFFLSKVSSSPVNESNQVDLVQEFLKGLPSPYSDKISVGVATSFFKQKLSWEEALEQITKNLASGVSLESGKFDRDTEKSSTVAREILICYPGEVSVFTSSRHLFPVGHRSEKSYILVWPEACGVLTFLGWD